MNSLVETSRARVVRTPLIALLGSQVISLVGNVLTLIAIPWFVLQTTGSAAKTGLAAACETLPIVLATFLGGAIVDRLGYKRASIVADVASMVTVASIPLLYYTVGLQFWQLLVLIFVKNLFDAPGTTAREALLPDVAVPAGLRLEQAGAAIQAVERGARLLGAPLAGVLIVLLGTGWVLLVDAATFALSALIVALAVPAARGKDSGTPSGSYLAQMKEGLAFIRRDRLVRAIVLTVMLTNLLDAPLSSVILPVYARRVLGSAVDLGLMIAAFGGGSLVGAVVFALIGHRLPRRITFATTFIIVALMMWLLVPLPPLVIVVVALALRGLASGPINPILSTVEYERIPQAMRARVLGAIAAGAYVAMPFGVGLAGYVLDWIGLRPTLLVQAVCYLVVTLSILVNGAFHDMDASATADTKPAA